MPPVKFKIIQKYALDDIQKDVQLPSFRNNMSWSLCKIYIYIYIHVGVSKPPIQNLNSWSLLHPKSPFSILNPTSNSLCQEYHCLPVNEKGFSMCCYYFNKLTNLNFLFIYMHVLQCFLWASYPSVLKVEAENCFKTSVVFCWPHGEATKRLVNYIAQAGCLCNPARCLHILITLAAGNL